MKVTLPNGLLDGQDHFNVVIIDELRGKQQNYLADRTLIENNIGHVPKILEDMILSLETKEGVQWQGNKKEAVYKLPASDIESLLVKIRENTFGPRYYFDAVCSHCGETNKGLRVDLDKLKVEKFTVKKMTDVAKRTIKLPKSGKTVVVKPMFMQDMFDSLKIAKDHQDELMTNIVALSVQSVDGVTEGVQDVVKALPLMDIYHIEESMEKMKLEGHIDTDVQIECSHCKKEFESSLNVYAPDFFLPYQGIQEYEYVSHEDDLLGDYAFFGQVWRWPPESINEMKWSYRKKLKQAYRDHVATKDGKK